MITPVLVLSGVNDACRRWVRQTLFDLENDPEEFHDLAKTGAHQDQIDRLYAIGTVGTQARTTRYKIRTRHQKHARQIPAKSLYALLMDGEVVKNNQPRIADPFHKDCRRLMAHLIYWPVRR